MRSARYDTWVDSLSPERMRSLSNDLKCLGALPYWKEPATVQQLRLAKTVNLYIGTSSITWRGVVAVYSVLQMSANMEEQKPDTSELPSYSQLTNPPDRHQFDGFASLVVREIYVLAEADGINGRSTPRLV